MNGGEDAEMPSGLPERAKTVYSVMRDDGRNTSSLHPRRTLDQFFYSSLPETSARDGDQVLSKNTEHSRGGKKMVMIDQLWLWVIRTKISSTRDGEANEPVDAYETAVFTCFPRKDEESEKGEEDLEAIADLRQAIVDEANGRDDVWAADWTNFVGLVLEQAVNVMLSVRNEQSLYFLDVFRMAIGKAVRDFLPFSIFIFIFLPCFSS